ncbi:hypothetical protein KKB69_01430 [Patescibacteria group bacterium]|nr:hypothetical protein [Patescibacteria group bacterium]
MEEKKHYVCSACGGCSDVLGNCAKESCEKMGQPMEECGCGNPNGHEGSKGCDDCCACGK